ncbi:uncharacterized protein LOC118438145 [Folsomia candida]|nr:uncharacterized protein LOC118438145 [Folsomia candida]
MRERGLNLSPNLFRKKQAGNLQTSPGSSPQLIIVNQPQQNVNQDYINSELTFNVISTLDELSRPNSPVLPSAMANATLVNNDQLITMTEKFTTVQESQLETYVMPDVNQRAIVSKPQKPYYGFDLNTILRDNEQARRIVEEKIPSNEFILRSDRIAVCNVLIDAIIKILGTNPSKQAMEHLAVDLVKSYPSLGDPRKKSLGACMWYQSSAFGGGPAGFLEERLKNQRKKLELNHVDIVDNVDICTLSWDSENEEENPERDEKILEYLRQNRGEGVISSMKTTVFMRRTVIRHELKDNLAGFLRLPGILPRLFDMEGMIVQDFDLRHPALKLVIYDRWPKASKLLLNYAEKSGVDYVRKLDIHKPRCDLTDNDVSLMAYALLPYILPSCARKIATRVEVVNEDEDEVSAPQPKRSKSSKLQKGRNKAPLTAQSRTVKASDLDSRNSLILFRSKNTHVSSVLSENKNPAPFILALGSTFDLKMESFFVILDKFAIPCGNSFMLALDTCLKSFTVFYLPPPVESKGVWQFLQYGIAGKPCENEVLSPAVQALIGQIMPRL